MRALASMLDYEYIGPTFPPEDRRASEKAGKKARENWGELEHFRAPSRPPSWILDRSPRKSRDQGPWSNFEMGGGGGGGTISDSILGGHKTLFLTNSL